MNAHYYSLRALDVARERWREAEQYRLAAAIAGARSAQPSRPRRLAAKLLATVSLGSAATVRRLDAHVADDLGRSIAPAE